MEFVTALEQERTSRSAEERGERGAGGCSFGEALAAKFRDLGASGPEVTSEAYGIAIGPQPRILFTNVPLRK